MIKSLERMKRDGLNKWNWTDRERFGDKAKVVSESSACLCVWECVFDLSLRVNVCVLQLSLGVFEVFALVLQSE